MTIRRRTFRRTRTIERVSIRQDRQIDIPEVSEGETFRLEIVNGNNERIYVCELTGKIDIEELPNGEFSLRGGRRCQFSRLLPNADVL